MSATILASFCAGVTVSTLVWWWMFLKETGDGWEAGFRCGCDHGHANARAGEPADFGTRL